MPTEHDAESEANPLQTRATPEGALAQAATLGRTLVVVPHPDDETLGCGGLLALLARAGMQMMVVLVSDGAASHPRSASYPAARLRALRVQEMISALKALGLGEPRVWAMGLPDGSLPSWGEPDFDMGVNRLVSKLAQFQPETVILPWRHDAHPDHRASHGIAWAACDLAVPRSRRLEYMVWGKLPQRPSDRDRAVTWHISIDSMVDRKRRAMQAHRSQLGQVIFDDPDGFVLPSELVARCGAPTETYFDTTAWRAP